MTTTTLRVARSNPHLQTGRVLSQPIREAIELCAVGVTAAILGAFWPPTALAALVFVAGGSLELSSQVFALGLPMLVVSVPTTAIWWLGAIRTRRAVRAFHKGWARSVGP